MQKLLVWTLDHQRYALPLMAVERVVPVVEVLPLPDAPRGILGLVNVHGDLLAVADMRARLQLPARAARLSDRLVLVRGSRRLAFIADSVVGAVEHEAPIEAVSAHLSPGQDFVSGVVQLADGLIVLHEFERFLSLNDEQRLQLAMSLAA